MTPQIEQQESGLQGHLPDCDDYAFSGAGFHPNCERICICRQVRRVEARVLKEARDAVAVLLPADYEMNPCAALDVIDALRNQP